jgi:hypothetical protein
MCNHVDMHNKITLFQRVIVTVDTIVDSEASSLFLYALSLFIIFCLVVRGDSWVGGGLLLFFLLRMTSDCCSCWLLSSGGVADLM